MQSLIPFSELLTWRETIPPLKKLILTNGCFDILHVGHVRYLQEAKALGHFLMVGLNSDQSVRQLKGPERPVNAEADRAEILLALSCVDFVTIFHDKSADALIEKVHPDLYVKAGDYSLETLPEKATILKLGVQTQFLPFASGYSTSNTISRLQGT